ncbi:hypothetical protein [Sorangium sp. So ce1000]|uniref:hypothetical protein n=1 Tax=Sorangium sp. So ce1000 TaxID=3133325 RepID=UPI003F60EC55
MRGLRRDRAARADALYDLFMARPGLAAYSGALLLSEALASVVEDPDEIELSEDG